MRELKTLLEIFQSEPDDAEIKCSHWTKDSWKKVGDAKHWGHSWGALNERVWQSKRVPREWTLSRTITTDGLNNKVMDWGATFVDGPMLKGGEHVKVREILE